MLGKLLNLTAGGGVDANAGGPRASHAGPAPVTPEPVSSLDSVQEDLHTRNLLYPDTQALLSNRPDQIFPFPGNSHHPAAAVASAFDHDGGIDLDRRDVRVLIMQSGIGSLSPTLLYDSQPPPVPPTPAVPDRPSTMGGMAHIHNHNQNHNLPLHESSRRGPASPRKPSLSHTARPVVIQPDSPQLRQSAAFDRRPSLHNRSHSRFETEAQRAQREYAEEIAVYSGCVFGTSELLAYRGTSTKLHVFSSDAPAARAAVDPSSSSSILRDGRGSLGRSSMRSSKLSQSFSSESAAMFSPPLPTSSSSSLATGSSRTPDQKRILITRLFPVTLPNDGDTGHLATPHGALVGDGGPNGEAYPFPVYNDDGTVKKEKKAQLKQKRTPMYAIALIVNLPQPPPLLPLPVQASPVFRSTFRGPGSYQDQESFPSSYGSNRRVGWTLATAAMDGPGSTGNSGGGGGAGGLGIDVPAADSAAAASSAATFGRALGATTTDLEERIDPITQHWDVIMRTLTQLQAVVSTTLLTLLRAVDVASPDPYPLASVSTYISRSASFGRRRSEDGHGGFHKAPKTNAKLLTLLPNALADMERVTQEVDDARSRIVVGLRALRVTTGQNRWGIWREEARWVSRWAASQREQNAKRLVQPSISLPPPLQQKPDQFLYNLLTAFLSTHTVWLRALIPSRYRKRHSLLRSTKANDDALPARTIIVSRDKAAARRIIFLLSAFLPVAHNFSGSSVRAHHASASMSWGALPQSPPASFAAPILKEQSLRRKINRRGPDGGSGRRSSHSRTLSGGGGGSLAPRSASMFVEGASIPLLQSHLYAGQHERRTSDATSIRTANLPFTGNDPRTRKSSAATMGTTTSDATIPHFATLQRADSSLSARPDSAGAGSIAADDLMRTLQRDDSNTSQHSPLFQMQQQDTAATADSSGSDADLRSQSMRWGSMLSGLLSGRRRDSTNGGGGHSRNSSASSWDLRKKRNSVTPSSPTKQRPETREYASQQQQQQQQQQHASQQLDTGTNKGPSVAEEDFAYGKTTTTNQLSDEATHDPHTPHPPHDTGTAKPHRISKANLAKQPSNPDGAFESALKTTINADGVVYVDIPFPEYMRSFETAVSSPSSSGFLSTPGLGSGLDSFEQSYRVTLDGHAPANVAGWLQHYHPDFCLQALPPQDDLLAQIKASLRREPLPPYATFDADQGAANPDRDQQPLQVERWVDVSSAIVVDTSSLTITRLTYSRLIRPNPAKDVTTPNTGSPDPSSPSLSVPADAPFPTQEVQQIDERIVEEPMVSTDSVLTKAIERVVAQGVAGSGARLENGTSANTAVGSSGLGTDNDSALSSRSASLRRGRRDSISSSTGPNEAQAASRPRYENPSPTALQTVLTPLGLDEVPRTECKTVILSALETIVRDVLQRRDKEDGAKDTKTGEQHAHENETGEPSLLRSAVQAWLENVDMGEI
ncbi:hypothetical protein SPI_02736 [Niveomyces insectorum RCEF 264]|uniref:Folliculin-interacting protein N-terminal domain-containing protein n=1 Tax=Niveomyces insectorum RCEF 264 TaxID=1081102 RepID=A0A167Y7S2_9HYPO|nr:hypothetical protein SPI_02736 [Niveomyces insectorum RCEF 264]